MASTYLNIPNSVKLTISHVDIGTVDQGTPNTLANAWPVKPTDGVNSQSFTALGEAIVSVTEPLPIGTNTIGNVNAIQSGLWSTGRTWNLLNTTDSVNIGNFPAVQPISGTVIANAGTGTFTVGQATGTNLHTVVDSGTITATQSGIWNINNISGTISLPTGASTSALQITGNSSLASIDSKLTTTANGLKVDGSAVTQPISAASLPLPTGAATSALQTTGNTSLSSIDGKLTTTVNGLKVDGSAVTQPISGTVTANAGTGNFTVVQPTGTNLHTVVDSGTITVNAGTGNFTVIQPSGSNLHVNVDVLPSIPTGTNTIGSVKITDGTNTASVTAASALKVDGSAVTQPISGTVTANAGTGNFTVVQATGTNLHTVVDSGTITANQGGTWNINNISGTISLPTGASTSANQTTANTSLSSIDSKLNTLGQKTMAGSVPVTLASNQTPISVNIAPINIVTSGVAVGQVATSALTRVPVYKTAYAEQTSDAQRSMSSSDVNDGPGGLGTHTVRITYMPLAGGSLKTEVVTLNGTTPVNTVNTDICYIEKMECITAGLAATNFGTISLFTTTAGGGSVFASIAIQDNTTFYAHHYVATGQTCIVTACSIGGTGNAAAETALFGIYKKEGFLGITIQISDFLHLQGTTSSNINRVYTSPLTVIGTAFKILMFVTPGSVNANTQYASFDWAST